MFNENFSHFLYIKPIQCSPSCVKFLKISIIKTVSHVQPYTTVHCDHGAEQSSNQIKGHSARRGAANTFCAIRQAGGGGGGVEQIW